MKRLILFMLISIPMALFSKCFDSEETLRIIASGDETQIEKNFKSTTQLAVSEANIFLNKLTKRIEKNFKTDIEYHSLRDTLWEIIDIQAASEYQKATAKNIFLNILDNSFQAQDYKSSKKFKIPNRLEALAMGTKVHPLTWLRGEVPSDVIIGAVETLAGALLWVTPFRSIGTGMMVDGVRRMLNGIQDDTLQS